MATDFEYVNFDNEPCLEQWIQNPYGDVHSILIDWGVVKAVSITEMEEWYEKVHAVRVEEAPKNLDPVEMRFNRLMKEWIRGTEKLSILSQIVLHPAYQQIIAMGPAVIPYILRSLEKQTDHWFWALKNLNEGHDVAEGETTMAGAATRWLSWGRENGHLG